MVFYGESYWLVKLFLTKGLALTYLIAFTVALRQYTGLVGEDGILPVKEFVSEAGVFESLSLFRILPEDWFMDLSAVSGMLVSVLVLLGVPSSFGTLPSMVAWSLMWLLFLSFVNTGQVFYSNGWELILLEAGFLAIFLGSLGVRTPEITVWLFRWLLFRMMFGAGVVKLKGDRCWRKLTCLDFHFETQPMPNPVSWYLHKLPETGKKLGVVFTHFSVLVVPFLYFAPQPYASIAGLATIIYQLSIFIGGNYAWLNLATAVLAFSTFSDRVLAKIVPYTFETASVLQPHPYTGAAVIAAGFIGLLSLKPVRDILSPGETQNRTYGPLHLVNTYGTFAEVSRKRKELVIEASTSKNPGEDDWLQYGLPAHSHETDKMPRQVSPYHHRLDYALWIAANREGGKDWIENLLERLLESEKSVEGLFREIPVDENHLEKVRISAYRYRFTTCDERRKTSKWWKREREDTFLGPISRQRREKE